jgi:uncharacterized protein (DUF1800 family)
MAGSSMAEGSEQADNEMAAKIAAEAVPDPGRQIYLNEAKTRIEAALGAEIDLAERLVWFWSNHFCFSANKIHSMAGAYEREAIRPFVLGRFGGHVAGGGEPPGDAVLPRQRCLDGSQLRGRQQPHAWPQREPRGEVLELHTPGVRSGYTQDDVLQFANVLTGWTFLPAGDNPEHGGEYTINRRLHEPGPQRIMDKVYEDQVSSRVAPSCATWRLTPLRRCTSQGNSRAASSPTSRPLT